MSAFQGRHCRFGLIGKDQFQYGPWTEEPDRMEWISRNLPCLVLRHPEGYLQGFVAIPWGQPLWGLAVGDLKGVSVHRGITYSAAASRVIGCTIDISEVADVDSLQADPTRLWWFGFRCNHAADGNGQLPGDFSPDDTLLNESPCAARCYRTFSYVMGEVERLAAQLSAEITRQSVPLEYCRKTAESRASKEWK
jgi:hypothetical protein